MCSFKKLYFLFVVILWISAVLTEIITKDENINEKLGIDFFENLNNIHYKINSEIYSLQTAVEQQLEKRHMFEFYLNKDIKEYFKKERQEINLLENEVRELKQRLYTKKESPSNPNSLQTYTYNYDKNFNCIEDCSEPLILPTQFQEVMENSSSKIDSVYLLKIKESQLPPFYAYCVYAKNHTWIIIQRRRDSSENFYKNWNNYKNGFGNVFGEYWLGLERLHEMTKNQKYEIWIQLKDSEGNEKNIFQTNFSIGNEANKYNLTVSEGDALVSGPKFSTYDNDNDSGKSINCAEDFKSAWWFIECFHSNLNGPYYGNPSSKAHLFWKDYDKDDSLEYVHMAIRPVL